MRIALLILSCTLLAACGQHANEPTNANDATCGTAEPAPADDEATALARRFLDATLAQDKEAAIACLRDEEQKEEDGVSINLNDEGLMKSYSMGKAEVNGEKAQVPVTVSFKNDKPDQTLNLQLVRENGEWRIDFMATIMQMMNSGDPE